MVLFSRKSKSSGFTLVELMVTTSIFVIVTALMVAKYGSFNQSVLLTNLAYDIGLTIRTAQTYGISVQGKDTTTPTFLYAYGVEFDKTAGGSPEKNKQIILFVDTNDDGKYTDGEKVSAYNIKRGAKIIGFCSSAVGCSTPESITNVNISFLRPNPDARICLDGALSPCSTPYVKIFVQGLDGGIRSVVVRQTGQVSVDE